MLHEKDPPLESGHSQMDRDHLDQRPGQVLALNIDLAPDLLRQSC